MEVEINGVIAELGNSVAAITRKSVEINNPSSRFVDFTNRFELPDTQINRQIFDSPNGIGTNNRSFDKLYDVVIWDHYQIFKGKGFLDSTTKDSFSFQVVDNSKDLLNSLDIPLSSVDWDDKDTTLTTAQIAALQSASTNSCWVWGKACLHENALQINTDQTTGNNRVKYSRPSFYVQGLLNRALTLQGYTLTSPLPDLSFSSCHDNFFFSSYQKTLSATYNPAGTLALSGLNTNDFAHADLTVASGSIGIGIVKTKFRLRGSVTASAAIDIIIRATDNIDGTKVVESKLSLVTGLQNIDFSSAEYQSAAGYTIDIRFVGTGSVQFSDCLLYTLISDKDRDLSTNPFLSYKIKAFDNLPDLTYLDLLRLICVVSNKFPVIDVLNKSVSFGSFANLNKMNAVDWSEKFVIGSEKTSAGFSGIAQKNWLKYENDLTVNPQLGWSYFNTDNESLSSEGDYLSLKFSGSNDVTINANSIAQVKVYSDTTRIQNQTINIRLFEVSGTLLQFAPLSWDKLAANYYANYFNSLYRIRAVDAELNLSKLDVISWYESKLVYIDYFKTTFIVLEISNFISGKLTSVKLLSYGR
jgi:hypothetical protein